MTLTIPLGEEQFRTDRAVHKGHPLVWIAFKISLAFQTVLSRRKTALLLVFDNYRTEVSDNICQYAVIFYNCTNMYIHICSTLKKIGLATRET
jgi:hypothetical protein